MRATTAGRRRRGFLERKYPQEYAKAQRIMDTTDTAVLKAAKELVLSVPSSIGGDE